VLKQWEKYISEHSMRAQELEDPHPEAISPKRPRKNTSDQSGGWVGLKSPTSKNSFNNPFESLSISGGGIDRTKPKKIG